MASPSVKRMKLANYMGALPEVYEVIEDNLGDENPSILLQTKSRIINLSCDDKGNVIDDFKMREGAGSREEYLAKQEAYDAVRSYYEDYYTGARITKNSFEEGVIKIQLDTKIVTLSYDAINKCVEEKDRLRKTNKDSESTNGNKPKSVKKQKEVAEPVDKQEDYQQLSLFDIPQASEEKEYKKWSDGTVVRNVCNNKKYIVKKDDGNIVEVFDKEYGYLSMARADLEIANE